MEGKRILVTIAHDLGRSNVEVVGEFGKIGLPGVMLARVELDSGRGRDDAPRLFVEIDATCVDVVGLPLRDSGPLDRYVRMLESSSEQMAATKVVLPGPWQYQATNGAPSDGTTFEFRSVVLPNINRDELEKVVRAAFDGFVNSAAQKS